jgi:hypothetical protein
MCYLMWNAVNRQCLSPFCQHRNHLRISLAIPRLWLLGWGVLPSNSEGTQSSAAWEGCEIKDFGIFLYCTLPNSPPTQMNKLQRVSGVTMGSESLCYHLFTICCLLPSWSLASVPPHPCSSFFLNYVSFIVLKRLYSDLWSPSVASSSSWNLMFYKHH